MAVASACRARLHDEPESHAITEIARLAAAVDLWAGIAVSARRAVVDVRSPVAVTRLEEGDPELTRCIRADLDCGDICTATAKVVARAGASGAPWIEQVRVCMQACAHGAEECESHAEVHDHCRACGEACRRCEQACRELLGAIG
jgi:hypothetical protein